MSYFYTKVPTQWSPSKIYTLPGDIYLKPANRTAYEHFPDQGCTSYLDSMFFITSDITKEDHIEKLRTWVMFHSLVLSNICQLFERGRMQTHVQVDSVEHVEEAGEKNAYSCNYDDIADKMYFLHKPSLQTSYKALYAQYLLLPEAKRNLISLYLLQLEPGTGVSLTYSLFMESRIYWQIVSYVSVLEAIISHAPLCAAGDHECVVCHKRFPHRQKTEKEWRQEYLSNIGVEGDPQKQYMAVINAAFDKIRHETAHHSIMPSPEYPDVVGSTEYDTERSINEFPNDTYALNSLKWKIQDVARYLLLNHLFNIKFFPQTYIPKSNQDKRQGVSRKGVYLFSMVERQLIK